MALCHKWDVKNDFAYVLQFFSLISDGLGSVAGEAFLNCGEELLHIHDTALLNKTGLF